MFNIYHDFITKDVRNPFELDNEEEYFYKPTRVGNFFQFNQLNIILIKLDHNEKHRHISQNLFNDSNQLYIF